MELYGDLLCIMSSFSISSESMARCKIILDRDDLHILEKKKEFFEYHFNQIFAWIKCSFTTFRCYVNVYLYLLISYLINKSHQRWFYLVEDCPRERLLFVTMSKISLNESEHTNSTNSLTTDDILSCYYEAFHTFRKNKSTISPNDLLGAMRCAGANPTEQELQDIKNKLDDGSGEIVFNDFCKVMVRIVKDNDEETFYKETFRKGLKENLMEISIQGLTFLPFKSL